MLQNNEPQLWERCLAIAASIAAIAVLYYGDCWSEFTARLTTATVVVVASYLYVVAGDSGIGWQAGLPPTMLVTIKECVKY
jgi:hypothetical protein